MLPGSPGKNTLPYHVAWPYKADRYPKAKEEDLDRLQPFNPRVVGCYHGDFALNSHLTRFSPRESGCAGVATSEPSHCVLCEKPGSHRSHLRSACFPGWRQCQHLMTAAALAPWLEVHSSRADAAGEAKLSKLFAGCSRPKRSLVIWHDRAAASNYPLHAAQAPRPCPCSPHQLLDHPTVRHPHACSRRGGC